MLDVVENGRVSDKEVEAPAGGDQELLVEEAPMTNSIMSKWFPKKRK